MNFAPYTFTYDDFQSEDYGIRFAYFDTSEHTVLGGGYTYTNFYSKTGHRNIPISALQTEENIVSFEIEMMAENGLSEEDESVVYDKLFNNLSFKKLIVDNQQIVETQDSETQPIYYMNCLFADPERINAIMDGKVTTVGYRCNLILDSAWMWSDKTVEIQDIVDPGSYTIEVETQIKDYTYPTITIAVGSTGGTVSIVNNSDDDYTTSFESLSPATEIVMTPDYCKIDYTGTGSIWAKFYDKHFFRLIPGDNSVTISGDVESLKIEYKEAHIL